jgi:hypothetical protein
MCVDDCCKESEKHENTSLENGTKVRREEASKTGSSVGARLSASCLAWKGDAVGKVE